MTVSVLESIATGNPPSCKPQREAAAFMQRIESLPAPIRKRIPQIYERSGIDFRYSCVEDFGREAEEFAFFPKTWTLAPEPTTHARNRLYRKAVLPLAEQVAREALEGVGCAPDAVTHIVVVSCTGFFAPGIDVELVKRLGLRPSTERTVIGFMGCYAAFNGLRVAHGFCRSNPNARVLLVCAELCTLHFQIGETLESAVVNALFSDGAAALLLSAREAEEAEGELAYADNHCLLDDDSLDQMTWDIGDTGFLMGLSPRVPDVIASKLGPYLETLLGRNGVAREEVDFWAIHPGGRAIVEKAQEVLGLSACAVHDSFEVLRLYGNMSSPTILFILQRVLERHRRLRADGGEGLRQGVALAFGPGLTLEGALFRRVGR